MSLPSASRPDLSSAASAAGTSMPAGGACLEVGVAWAKSSAGASAKRRRVRVFMGGKLLERRSMTVACIRGEISGGHRPPLEDLFRRQLPLLVEEPGGLDFTGPFGIGWRVQVNDRPVGQLRCLVGV